MRNFKDSSLILKKTWDRIYFDEIMIFGLIKIVIISEMNTPKKQIRLEDITYYSHSRESPFSYTRSRSRTPTPKNYATKAVPLQSQKNRGIMGEALAERVQYYKKNQKN